MEACLVLCWSTLRSFQEAPCHCSHAHQLTLMTRLHSAASTFVHSPCHEWRHLSPSFLCWHLQCLLTPHSTPVSSNSWVPPRRLSPQPHHPFVYLFSLWEHSSPFLANSSSCMSLLTYFPQEALSKLLKTGITASLWALVPCVLGRTTHAWP